MVEMIDCMVNYFGSNANSQGVPRHYFCYLVVAGPGPTADGGVATITTLAVHEEGGPCFRCQNTFFSPQGGSEAALARAVHYLDTFHDGDRLRKVMSQVRRSREQELVRPIQDDPGSGTESAKHWTRNS